MVRIIAVAVLAAGAVLTGIVGWAEPTIDPSRVHIEFYKKVRPAIVGVRGPQGDGTGFFISSDGLILTSAHITGEKGPVTVWMEGYRRVPGRVVHAKRDMEVALVRIEAKAELPCVKLGDSDKLKIGERIYVVGNANGAIIADDMPALTVGVLSGRFYLRERRGGHLYTGLVLETSAAVNSGLDGAPFLNRDGEAVGMVTLNYSTRNWTGLAIPINVVRRVIAAAEQSAAR